MERVLTKDIGRRKAGEVYDYPRSVWRNMAQASGRSLESFSRSIVDAAPKRAKRNRQES